MRIICLFFGFILVFILSNPVAAEYKVNVVPNKESAKPFITVDDEGNVYVLHYGNDETLYILKNDVGVVAKLKKDGAIGSFQWLGFPEGKPTIIWRPKFSDTGNKFVYFDRAEDKTFKFEKEVVINNAKDALLPIDVAWKDKTIYVSWADERKSPRNIHMNFSTDGGRTFRGEDINITPGYGANLGKVLIGDKRLYLFFLGRKTDKENEEKSSEGKGNIGIFARTSEDGVQWSEVVPVSALEDWTPGVLNGIMTPEGPLFFWAGPRGIWYAYPDGEGKWHAQPIAQTKDMDVNRIDIGMAKNGDIYMISSYKKTLDEAKKPSVYFSISHDSGKTWSDPAKINHNKYDNTSSMYPDMHMLDNGTIVVVWQDHRLIRGNIYMNYSKDGGKTWLPEDINLDEEPGKNNDFYPFITGYKDGVYVLIPRYRDDSVRGELDLYHKEVKIDN